MTTLEQSRLLAELIPACDEGDVENIHAVMCRHFYSLNGARSTFCVSDTQYHRTFLPEARSFGEMGRLHSFFRDRRIMTMKNQGEGENFQYTYTISCDTQFPSYLRSRQRGIAIAGMDDSITECLRFLAPYRSGINIGPYLFENQDRLDSPQVKETIYAFLEFSSAETEPLEKHGRIVSTRPNDKLAEETQDMMDRLKGEIGTAFATIAKKNWSIAYVTLLLAAAVHINNRQQESNHRLARLLELMDEMGFFPKVEIHLVHRFFERGNQERFFRGVQENAARLSEKLKNMAWDLSHKRTIFDQTSLMAVGVKEHADFIVPYMLSFDGALTQLLSGYQVNGVVNYFDQTPKFLEVYPIELETAISEGFSRVPHLIGAERTASRLQRAERFLNDENEQASTIASAEEILRQAIYRK